MSCSQFLFAAGWRGRLRLLVLFGSLFARGRLLVAPLARTSNPSAPVEQSGHIDMRCLLGRLAKSSVSVSAPLVDAGQASVNSLRPLARALCAMLPGSSGCRGLMIGAFQRAGKFLQPTPRGWSKVASFRSLQTRSRYGNANPLVAKVPQMGPLGGTAWRL